MELVLSICCSKLRVILEHAVGYVGYVNEYSYAHLQTDVYWKLLTVVMTLSSMCLLSDSPATWANILALF